MAGLPKAEVRLVVRSRLGSMQDAELLQKSHLVRAHLLAMFAEKFADKAPIHILSYRANSEWREVDLSSIESELPRASFSYVAPEPSAPFPEANYDIIFVPLQGFNRDGFRLGHGGGWYDRFLQTQPSAVKVGVGLEAGSVQFEPEEHDIAMDAIVTEAEPRLIRS